MMGSEWVSTSRWRCPNFLEKDSLSKVKRSWVWCIRATRLSETVACCMVAARYARWYSIGPKGAPISLKPPLMVVPPGVLLVAHGMSGDRPESIAWAWVNPEAEGCTLGFVE